VVLAPGFAPAALEELARKKNLRLLECPPYASGGLDLRRAGGGFLVQEADPSDEDRSTWKAVTKVAPTDRQLDDMAFAMKVCAATGSNAIAQYAPRAAARLADLRDESMLLWFHHVPWDHRMASGRTLWDELVVRYSRGVAEVAAMRRTWSAMAPYVDPERHAEVAAHLAIQEQEAQWWRDACIAYFQTFSQRPLPEGYAPPKHPLAYYGALSFPYAPGQ